MKALTLIGFAVAVFAVIKWFVWKITAKSYVAAYLRWLNEKKIEPPGFDTIKEYQKWAVRMMFKDLLR